MAGVLLIAAISPLRAGQDIGVRSEDSRTPLLSSSSDSVGDRWQQSVSGQSGLIKSIWIVEL